MKYLCLVWSALRRKPTRTLLTSLSIVMAFLLFGVLQGVSVGIAKLIDSSRADHLLVQSRVSMGTPLPLAHIAPISALPGVTEATGVTLIFGTNQDPRRVLPMTAGDIPALFRIYSEIMWAAPEQIEAIARLRSGAIVGRALMEMRGWKIGDRIPYKALNVRKADGTAEWMLDIVGVYDRDQPETAMSILVNYDYINEARGAGKNTLFQVIVGVRDPARTAQIAQQIDELFANSPNQTITQTERDFFEGILSQVGDINFMVNAIVGAVLFTLLFLTANTMAQSVRERIPELAVLKTLGFTDGAVQWLVLAESFVLCVLAALVGLVLAVVILPKITSQPAMSLAAMHVPNSVFFSGAVFAVLVAVISGAPLARRARRLDIASALSGR